MVFLFKVMLFAFALMLAPTSWASIIDQQMIERATIAGINDYERLEYLYLQAFTAELMESSYQYASISGNPTSYELKNVDKLQRCQDFLPDLEGYQQRIWLAKPADPDQYFLQLTTLSLFLAHANLKMHELGFELKKLDGDVLDSVMSGKPEDVDGKRKILEAKIKKLSDNIDSVFNDNSSNFLLTMDVLDDEGKKRPFFQEIVSDYYDLLSEGITGDRLIIEIQQRNSGRLVDLFKIISEDSRGYLQTAWDHTCRQRKISKRDSLARVGFYFKHHALMDKVERSLEADSELLKLHQQLKEDFNEQVDPSNYQTSAKSFLGFLGVLSLPVLFVKNNLHKRIVMPIIAVAGLVFTHHQRKALIVLREQLKIGAFSSLNSYQQYRYFNDNTSVSKYTASHLAAVGLALLFIHSKGKPPAFNGKEGVVKGIINVAGSLGTLFAIEGLVRGTFNPLKDEGFFFNLFLTIGLDFATGFLASFTIPHGQLVALTAISVGLLSIVTHVVTGREMNWDRIIYDVAFISIFSLWKAKWFLTKIPDKIVNKYNPSKNVGYTIRLVLSLVNNAFGNAPYSLSTRYWLEDKREYGRLPIDNRQPELQFNKTSGELITLVEEDNLTNEALIKLFSKQEVY